ncbi:MAG: FAD-dependent monooxygenase [Gammaproteobacteria bacterium]|nr:FAD-dependent monooxygenase [Gammaproteobacteria bacterium]
MTATLKTDYDLLIIGAGLVGTSLVAALRSQGFKIAMLEKHLPSALTSSQLDTRPLALNYASFAILKTLGLWDSMAALASPIQRVHISEENRFGKLEFNAKALNVEALGYVVPVGALQQTLYHTAANVADIMVNETLNKITLEPTASVDFKSGDINKTLSAQLIIAADGSQSTCRELLNIKTDRRRPHEVALIAEIRLEESHQHSAYQRFTREGILALLPLADECKMRLVWTLPNKTAEIFKTLDAKQLCDKVRVHFRNYVGPLQSLKILAQYPLQTIIAHEQVRSNFALVGNAAHTLYPLAAQGFNLGLRDVALLSELLADGNHQQLGDIKNLTQYLTWREPNQKQLNRLTTGLHDLFSLHLPLLGGLRGLGLLAADLAPPIKQRIARQVLGLNGRQAKLQRGILL